MVFPFSLLPSGTGYGPGLFFFALRKVLTKPLVSSWTTRAHRFYVLEYFLSPFS
ncbi:hypothetical protein BD779DRAFT_1539054, partial [Infundibulicybe gibba]